MAKTDPHEDNHNIRLAQLLREKGLAAGEVLARQRQSLLGHIRGSKRQYLRAVC